MTQKDGKESYDKYDKETQRDRDRSDNHRESRDSRDQNKESPLGRIAQNALLLQSKFGGYFNPTVHGPVNNVMASTNLRMNSDIVMQPMSL